MHPATRHNPTRATLATMRGAGASPRVRGMSLLEVVFAVVLLALVASAVTSAISFVGGSEVRAQRRLGAYELANRLILQYLDDPTQMPDRTRPVDYDRFRYRWDLEELQVRMRTPNVPAQRQVVAQANDRFKQVVVTVYAVDEDAPFQPAAEQLATLTRIYDPFAPRNPDAVERLDPNRLLDLLQQGILGSDLPAGGAGGARRQGDNGGGAGGDK